VAIKCPKCRSDNTDTARFCSNCAAPLHPSEKISAPTETLETPKEELTRGTTLASRYEIIEELGKGGMGKVYRVEDTKIKEEVALKLIKPEIASDKRTIERFSNELKFARKIRHKNVCQMYDLSETEGTHYITMEYVPGEDLKSTIRRIGQLPIGKSISIAKQVCDGLSEAHRLGVVHRDLKPSNIMIDKEGNARIMDFGIARSLKAKGITGEGIMIGTPEYVSPEQAEAKEVDQRSDIYSLGVILYEMMTGKLPFEGDTPLSIAMKHKSEMPKDPKELNVQIPEDLSRLILKCMEKDRQSRYQEADEVFSELEKIEEGLPLLERVIPKKKPITSKEITVTFGLKKFFVVALAVVAIAAIAIIIWQLLPQKEAVPIPTDKPSLAVMYFENNTGDESLDHWRKALSELLIADLSQSKHIRVLGRDRLFNILGELNLLEAKSFSSKDLEEVASRGGVNHLLQGAYAKAGDNIRINVMLQEASTGELIGSESVEGMGEKSMFSIVDELTRRIKANFKLSEEAIASDIDKEVEKITTSSPEAFKYYIEGIKYQDKGDMHQSIQFFEKAIAIDPEFSLAYRYIAVNYANLGYPSERDKYMKKALEFIDRVSDKERYILQGSFYNKSERTYDKAIDAFSKLVEVYPKESLGLFNLGRLYLILEEWDKAIERFKEDLENPFSVAHLSMAFMAKGLYDKAREALEAHLGEFLENPIVISFLARSYLCQGKYELALVKADKAFSLNPANYNHFWVKGDIYLCKGDLIRAENEYLKLMELEEQAAHLWAKEKLGPLYLMQGKFDKSKNESKQGIKLEQKLGNKEGQSYFHILLAYAHLKSGNFEEALKEYSNARSNAAEAGELSYERFALYGKGVTFLELKSIDEAQKTADELKVLIERGMNWKAIRYYHHLMGMIELERGNLSKAIEYFKKASSLVPYQSNPASWEEAHALFLDPLALVYYKAGDLEKAREEYERITLLTSGRLYYGDIYAKSFYMLGKIFEQKGWKGKAIEHYEKFLDLWKDADPGIAEVEDAKKRLASLES